MNPHPNTLNTQQKIHTNAETAEGNIISNNYDDELHRMHNIWKEPNVILLLDLEYLHI